MSEINTGPSLTGGLKAIRGYLHDYYQNLMDIPGQENDVATGFAIGIFISFSPWIGLHIIIIFILTKLFRKSFGAGVLASLVFNPLTAPFLWTIEYRTGKVILNAFTDYSAPGLKLSFTDFSVLWDNFVQAFYPILVGGTVLGVPAAIAAFLLVQRSLRLYRKRVYGKVSERLKARHEKKSRK